MTSKAHRRRITAKARAFQKERRKEHAWIKQFRNVIPKQSTIPSNLKDVSPHKYLTVEITLS